VAAAVASSPVRAELVAALDDWAALPVADSVCERILGVLRRDCILGVLRLADPGPWLDIFRTPAARANAATVWWLARFADPDGLHPATLTALAVVMQARGLDPTELLLRAQFAHPNEFLIPFQLGLWHHFREEYDAAIAQLTAARVTRPENQAILTNLGAALHAKGDVDGAIEAFREATRLNPNDSEMLNTLARVRAVGPDGMRDGKEAVKLATRACELTGWKNPGCIDTLAAAYAEAGGFDKAVEYQKKAADLAAGNKELEADIRSRIGLYERKKPYRDPRYTRRELAPPREVKR